MWCRGMGAGGWAGGWADGWEGGRVGGGKLQVLTRDSCSALMDRSIKGRSDAPHMCSAVLSL